METSRLQILDWCVCVLRVLLLVRVVFLHVDAQVLFPGEALGAEGAGVRALARVHRLVGGEVPRLGEALAALPAAEGPLAGVYARVCVQALGRGEALPAVHTDEAAPVRVCVRVCVRVSVSES